MTAEQAACDPRSGVVGPPVVAEVVLVDVAMKVFQRTLIPSSVLANSLAEWLMR